MTDLLNAIVLLSNFLIIPGLTYGSQLALGALGVTLVYGVLRFSNFGHGETMSFGAMVTILTTWGLQSIGVSIHPLPTALIAIPVGIIVTIFFTLLIDQTVYKYHRTRKANPVTFLIVSIGVMFFMGGLIRFIIGPGDQIFFDGTRFILKAKEFKELTGLDEGLSLKMTQGVTIITAIIIVAGLFWFLNHTRTGKSMRAYSDNENLALLSGINPRKVVLVTWILVATLATIAGTLYGLDKSFKPFVYMQLLLPIFASAIVGGVGNPVGAIVGGYVIAFSELIMTFAYKKVVLYLAPEGTTVDSLIQLLGTNYKIAVSFIILVIVLIIRPTGIFQGKTL
ncbi:branched-chain amino acid ABC transporter permease [Litorivicinus sp.]|jgi:branched-chain amino acid transport system permease protein|nr:branched-chain amino acid ABC transporter permease [Litorivicinus sp.]|tara:strand:- start:6846 stop:7859 length:1014 start_codon:yes stop_codon:yes gene_type:complete